MVILDNPIKDKAGEHMHFAGFLADELTGFLDELSLVTDDPATKLRIARSAASAAELKSRRERKKKQARYTY